MVAENISHYTIIRVDTEAQALCALQAKGKTHRFVYYIIGQHHRSDEQKYLT